MGEYTSIICIYLAAISLLAIGMTLYDKRAAKKSAWRIKELTLLVVSLLGGSVAMFATMWIAHHKTKHLKFVVGIPVIIALQIAVIVYVWR